MNQLTDQLHEGYQLRDHLQVRQISQKQFALTLGMTTSNVNWMTHRPILSARHRQLVLTALAMSYDEFAKPFPEPTQGEGQQLREYMRRNRIQMKWLAARLGVKATTISGYYQSHKLEATTRQAILTTLEASHEQVFLAAAPEPTSLPEPVEPVALVVPLSPQAAQDALSLARRQLGEWQALARQLATKAAPAAQLSFCQYQIWHLELSLPALGLSVPLPAQSSQPARVES